MLGRVECEPCDGYGEVVSLTLDGDRVEVDCKACGGLGGFEIYGPPTRERLAEIEAQDAARAAESAKWVTFVCTHCATYCATYCDAHADGGPRRCWRCDDGVLVPLADLQAAARPVLPWRREGDRIVAVPPPAIEVRTVDDTLDEVVATKGASVHLEALSDFDPAEDQPACWWLGIEVGAETVHVTLSAQAPISAVVERWTEPPREGECDPPGAADVGGGQ